MNFIPWFSSWSLSTFKPWWGTHGGWPGPTGVSGQDSGFELSPIKWCPEKNTNLNHSWPICKSQKKLGWQVDYSISYYCWVFWANPNRPIMGWFFSVASPPNPLIVAVPGLEAWIKMARAREVLQKTRCRWMRFWLGRESVLDICTVYSIYMYIYVERYGYVSICL